jgi:hypothetical protein
VAVVTSIVGQTNPVEMQALTLVVVVVVELTIIQLTMVEKVVQVLL